MNKKVLENPYLLVGPWQEWQGSNLRNTGVKVLRLTAWRHSYN